MLLFPSFSMSARVLNFHPNELLVEMTGLAIVQKIDQDGLPGKLTSSAKASVIEMCNMRKEQ